MNASLNEKLSKVEWGEYKLGDLFEIESTSSFNTDRLVFGNEYDYVTRTSLNQGILRTTGFVNKENINPSGTWSLGLLQMDFFYRRKPWYAGQFVRKITPKITIKDSSILFFTTLLNKQKSRLLSVLVRDVDDVFHATKINLPTKNRKIDFDFMESFIAELEAQRIAELSAYLKVSGFDNYELSDEELDALQKFRELSEENWGTYKVGNLFERVKTKKLPYKAKELPKQPTEEYVLPCLTSSFQNQGLNYYAPKEGATILSNVISIPSNSDIYRAYYQSRDFTVLSDSYTIRWRDNKTTLLPNQYLFMVMCINKVTDLPIYSYKNKLGGWNVVKEKHIRLPQKNDKIDLGLMDSFISAMKKLTIKDVALYADRKIEATKTIVSSKSVE
ncbi:restriction endonuclease subunit S [[Eubacterium] siraeum]|uniref:Restriction endonuclease subunit S n=1 Tax=[Eubacterium] siraeum TaxID=39492 RepID=A0AAW6CYB5_9FIRM|nr:restriction endonuclease subunit S [[Eubacterium] siraeum]MDB8003631.1 restriction endonuclease subunit S [[Eubacterium] siraeum]